MSSAPNHIKLELGERLGKGIKNILYYRAAPTRLDFISIIRKMVRTKALVNFTFPQIAQGKLGELPTCNFER